MAKGKFAKNAKAGLYGTGKEENLGSMSSYVQGAAPNKMPKPKSLSGKPRGKKAKKR